MKHAHILAVIMLLGDSLLAADSGEPVAEPKVMLKMIEAIETAKIDELTSKATGGRTTYPMRGLHYLGTVRRDGQTYTIAHAVFVRSSPPGQDTPPPRGHDFIIVFDGAFRLVSHGRAGFGDYRMVGDRLMFGEALVADFATIDPVTRYRGFVEIGLPYPFADRISEEDWQSGSFQR